MEEELESIPMPALPAVGGRIHKVTAAVTLGMTLYRQGKHFYETQKSRRQFEIVVPSDSELYLPVEQWILSMLGPTEVRSVEARTSKWKNQRSSTPVRFVIASFDSSINQRMEIDGFCVRVTSQREQPTLDLGGFGSSPFDSSSPGVAFGATKKTIRVECKSAEARDHILGIMDELLQEHDRDRQGSRCFVLGGWGDWNRRDFMARRPLDTVYLPGGMREDVAADLERFLGQEEEYLRLGLPWHRGYMFSGVPGTGKTSLAKALASHFDLDIYVIALPDLKRDGDLSNALSRIESPSILLIEDIDVASASHSREESESPGISLSGLLNALDGVGTPHGLVTIMTSNHPEILDPALVRAGRVDYKLECPPMSGREIRLMVEEILDIEVKRDFSNGVVAADVMEVLKRNIHRAPHETLSELVLEFG